MFIEVSVATMIKTISMKHEVRKVENSSSDFIYGHILKWRLMEWSGVGSQSQKPSVMMGRRDVGESRILESSIENI